MKHLKAYESEQYTPEQFSKYLVWYDDKNNIKIIQNNYKIRFWEYDENQPVLDIKHLYSFNPTTNKLTEPNFKTGVTNGIFLAPDTMPRILYQADTLKKIYNNLELISQSIKYNL